MFTTLMLKLCHNSIDKPLNLLFKYCLGSGSFPSEWKVHGRYINILYVSAISKVWNQGFFFKLNQSGVYNDLPKTLT